MTSDKIKRINELALKQRTASLSESEKKEQAVLRREYIDSMKASLENQLENTYIIRPDGTRKKVGKK